MFLNIQQLIKQRYTYTNKIKNKKNFNDWFFLLKT